MSAARPQVRAGRHGSSVRASGDVSICEGVENEWVVEKKKKQAGFDAAGLGGRGAEHRENSQGPPCPVLGIGSGSSAEQHPTLLWSHRGNRKLCPS